MKDNYEIVYKDNGMIIISLNPTLNQQLKENKNFTRIGMGEADIYYTPLLELELRRTGWPKRVGEVFDSLNIKLYPPPPEPQLH